MNITESNSLATRQVPTNQFSFSLKRDEFQKSFAVYEICCPRKGNISQLYEEPLGTWPVLSVVSTLYYAVQATPYPYRFYILSERTTSWKAIFAALREKIEECTIQKLDWQDVYSSMQPAEQHQFYDWILIKLLWHCLDGQRTLSACLIPAAQQKQGENQYMVLEAVLTKDQAVLFSNFTLTQASTALNYLKAKRFPPCFRRLPHGEWNRIPSTKREPVSKQVYFQCNPRGAYRMNFLQIATTIHSFETAKMAYWNPFWELLHQCYDSLLTATPVPMELTTIMQKTKGIGPSLAQIQRRAAQKEWVIYMAEDTPAFHEGAQYVKRCLETYSDSCEDPLQVRIVSEIVRPSVCDTAYTLQIVPDKPKKNALDSYTIGEKIGVQHLRLSMVQLMAACYGWLPAEEVAKVVKRLEIRKSELSPKKPPVTLDAILSECLIKEEVRLGKVQMVAADKLSLPMDFYLLIPEKNSSKGRESVQFSYMILRPDLTFTMGQVSASRTTQDFMVTKLVECYFNEDLKRKQSFTDKQIEYLFAFKGENPHAVYVTPIRILPELQLLKEEAYRRDDKHQVPVALVLDAIDEYLKGNIREDYQKMVTEDRKKLTALCKDGKSSITMKELRDTLHASKANRQKLSDSVELYTSAHGNRIQLKGFERSKRGGVFFGLDRYVGIQISRQPKTHSLYYVGGYNGLGTIPSNRVIAVSQVVREITNADALDIHKFFNLFDVNFVRRSGQYTVRPFPFKYLQEYIRFQQRKMVAEDRESSIETTTEEAPEYVYMDLFEE